MSPRIAYSRSNLVCDSVENGGHPLWIARAQSPLHPLPAPTPLGWKRFLLIVLDWKREESCPHTTAGLASLLDVRAELSWEWLAIKNTEAILEHVPGSSTGSPVIWPCSLLSSVPVKRSLEFNDLLAR